MLFRSQRLAGGFGNQLPDNEHIGHAHEGEQQECAGGGKVLEHPGGELAHKRCV